MHFQDMQDMNIYIWMVTSLHQWKSHRMDNEANNHAHTRTNMHGTPLNLQSHLGQLCHTKVQFPKGVNWSCRHEPIEVQGNALISGTGFQSQVAGTVTTQS